MATLDEPKATSHFELSLHDMSSRIRNSGWGFWRGFILGAACIGILQYALFLT